MSIVIRHYYSSLRFISVSIGHIFNFIYSYGFDIDRIRFIKVQCLIRLLFYFNSGSTIQGDHILAFWQTQKKWIHSEQEHLEHTAQRFTRHAHVILTTLWLITYRK